MLNLFTETAFPTRPSTPASLIHIPLPLTNNSDRKHRNSKQSHSERSQYARDENSYAKQFLASSGSIYCRQTKTYPRTFVWRVLDDGYSLQIQCADTARSALDQKEAHLTLCLEAPSPILPGGVALSDADRGDILNVFVLTTTKDLYTISLHTSFFRLTSSIPKDMSHWCYVETPTSFTIDQPYRLFANHPYELFISFEAGRLVRLTRKAEEHSWTQDYYDDKSWGASIRGIVSRRGNKTISYQGKSLDPSAVHALVAASDSTHVFTVCLNHTLRVWNLATGRLVVSKDLLDKERLPQETTVLNPAEPDIIRLVKLEHLSHPILVTYSPQDGGQFKFWDVKGGLTSPISVEDKYPSIKLSPPDPDPSGNTVWSLTGFCLNPGDQQRQSELWVLWRNNNHHRLYSLNFDFSIDFAESWVSNWVQTVNAPSTKHTPPNLIKSDAQDITPKWLDFLFHPGRYPSAVLETALAIYQDAMSQQLASSERKKSLSERMCRLIATNVALRKYGEADMDYERFITDTDYQWRNYWKIVESINEGRQAPVSLCLDMFSGMIWLTMSDYCCAVRECSNFELLLHNEASKVDAIENGATGRWGHRKVSSESGEPFSRISALIAAAGSFRKSFSADLISDIETALEEELLLEPELPIPVRLNEFYETVGFGDAITNEAYNQLEHDVSEIGGFGGLSNEFFIAILDSLLQTKEKPRSALRSTVFASSLLSAGMQDVLTARRQVLFDLLAFVVFVEGEVTQEDGTSLEFDGAELFEQLLLLLKECDKNLWLVSHSRQAPLEFPGPDPAPNTLRTGDQVASDDSRSVTILEDAIGKAIRPQPAVDRPQTHLLTEMLQEIEAWISGQDEISPEDGIVYIQCDLITQGDIDLASDFNRFQPSTAWATYVRARLCTSRKDFSSAGIYFRKAAYSLACGKAIGSLDEMSAGLISMIDLDSFNNGLPRYYQHVMSLFESVKAFAQAGEFARLALQSLQPGQKEPVISFRSEILSRLFTAEMKCSRFSNAYDALIQFTDQALQKSSLIALVNAIFNPKTTLSGAIGSLQILQNFPLALHPHLARHVDQHLSAMAKKQSSIPDASVYSTPTSQVDYLQVLHGLRMGLGDYRGAVSVLFDRLRIIRKSSRVRSDPQAIDLRNALLAVINTMSCVAPDEAYILTDFDEQPGPHGTANGQKGSKKRKRIIVTLEDLRKEYQQLLDRCSRIERGDFDFDVDGESDLEDDMDQGRVNGDAMEM